MQKDDHFDFATQLDRSYRYLLELYNDLKATTIKQQATIAKLEADNKKLNSEIKYRAQCNVCLEHVSRPVVLVPCGHGNMHKKCAEKSSTDDKMICPLCGDHVDKIISLLI